MKTIIKKIFITYLVIICCIYTPTAQAAGWSFGGFNFGNGSLNIVKDGVKITTAAVDSAPITSNLGSKILSGALRGAGFLSALSLAVGIAEDAIDWVLDPDNNAIKYKSKNTSQAGQYWAWSAISALDDSNFDSYAGTTAQDACIKLAKFYGKQFGKVTNITATSAKCWWSGSSTYDQDVKLFTYTPTRLCP